jgi:hypothetical protein
VPVPKLADFLRIPGLFRRWELQQVVTTGPEFHIEPGGQLSDGTQLFAIYSRQRQERQMP